VTHCHDCSCCGYVCYACNTDVSGKYANDSQLWYRIDYYERVVEYIEALPPGARFSRVTVWQALRGGPKEHNLVYRVVRDMLLHGLIRCVHRTKGNKCWSYEVVRNELA